MMKSRLFLLLLAAAGLAVAFAPLPVRRAIPQERTFRVEARQFAYSPAELRVNPGDTVTIELVSTDVVHGLYVDGYGVSVEADPGQTGTLTFTADKAGSYRVRCNVTCGAMHPFMIGKLNVGPNQWLYRSVGLAVIGLLFPLLYPLKKKADELARAGEASMRSMAGTDDMLMHSPVDFTAGGRMLGASPDLLQGKILWGGMGTGMPM